MFLSLPVLSRQNRRSRFIINFFDGLYKRSRFACRRAKIICQRNRRGFGRNRCVAVFVYRVNLNLLGSGCFRLKISRRRSNRRTLKRCLIRIVYLFFEFGDAEIENFDRVAAALIWFEPDVVGRL